MTAEEIRKWHKYSHSHKDEAVIEIAAQLADLNEKFQWMIDTIKVEIERDRLERGEG